MSFGMNGIHRGWMPAMLVVFSSAACSAVGDSATETRTEALVVTQRGVDYSLGRPAPAALRAAGYTFAVRYLSYSTNGKNLTPDEAHALQAAGVDVVVVWEFGKYDALNGFQGGVNDANDAQHQADTCGMPAGRPIYFAVDFDAQPGQQDAINAYFDGVASVLGRARVGAYGGLGVIQRLFDSSKIQWGWQTYAWSHEQWDDRAQLRQVQNGVVVAGAQCDIDEATTADFGQWGQAQSANETQVIAIGLDDMLYHDLRHSDGSWSGYGAMGFGANEIAIAGTRNGETQVVAVGWDTVVYHNLRHADGSWTGFQPILKDGANFNAKGVAIAGTPNGETQVVAVGQDYMLYHNLRHADGSWSGYNPMGFGADQVAIAGTRDGETQVVVVGWDEMVYHNLRHGDGSWTGFAPLLRGGAKFGAKRVGIAGTPNGESQVVAIGQDRMLYHNLRHADGNWEGYNPMGFGANEVTIAGTSNGEAQIVVSGLDGMVYHELRHTDGSWTSFQPVLRGDAKFGAKKVGIAGL